MATREAINVRVYAPGIGRGWGLSVWREMLREQLAVRELIWRLFARDFAARYRQSVFGFLWAAIVPVVAVGTFVLMNQAGILNAGESKVPYAVFVLSGLTVWQIFAGGLIACSSAIVAGGSMVVKINFPKETLVFAALSHVVVDFIVRLALLAVLMAAYRVQPGWTALVFPFVTLPLWFLTLGLGFILAFSNALIRDVSAVITVGMTFLMFLTPVVYAPPESGWLADIMRVNPLSILITAPRQLLFDGRIADPWRFTATSVACVVIFFLGWRVFHLAEPRVVERV